MSRSVILGLDAVDTEARNLAADVNSAVVHRIAEIVAGVAEDDHATALHHEAGEGADAAADDDRAALLVDADTRAQPGPCTPGRHRESPRRTRSPRSFR